MNFGDGTSEGNVDAVKDEVCLELLCVDILDREMTMYICYQICDLMLALS